MNRYFLRRSVVVSFVLGTAALCLYGINMFRPAQASDDLWETNTKIIYSLGLSWWILTCAIAYLGPCVMKLSPKFWNAMGCCRKSPQPTTTESTTSSKSCCKLPMRRRLLPAFVTPQRLIFWGLVVLPSVWVFAYGTSQNIPFAKNRIVISTDNITLFQWVSILVVASALPSGTAGMISMGIYVFGTVAKHSPLWSAYVVLPAEREKGSGNDKNNSNNNNSQHHANLMKDALRLHQWAGYVTLVWFALHTLLYCTIYGYRGITQHAAAAKFSVDAATSSGPSTTMLFLGAVWQALYPPPECRPILSWNLFHHGQKDELGMANQTNHGKRLYRILHEENGNEDTHPTTNSTSKSKRKSSIYVSSKFEEKTSKTSSSNTTHIEQPKPKQQPHKEQQSETKHSSPQQCYGYYRNFNGFLAISALLALVLTSLTFVRRANYRFFYASHIITATVFTITMILHMKRILIYLMPSLVCYFATTIPTLIQNWVGAVLDKGVCIEDYTVLESSSNTKGDNNGVVELTFLVEPDSGEVLEVTACTRFDSNSPTDESIIPGNTISHRPKSVKICVPSISLLWYPFTVIEPTPVIAPSNTKGDDSGSNHLLRYKILFGTVGYFTKSLWRRLYDLQLLDHHDLELVEQIDEEATCNDDSETFDDEHHLDSDKTVSTNRTTNLQRCHQPPLLLVDGFYSGATDWIENARHHDVVLIAAGGTGVTPFLTFFPKLMRYHQMQSASIEANASKDVCNSDGLESFGSTNSSSQVTVSFLWCCRDEALIRHVITTYLLPLFQNIQEQQPEHKGAMQANDKGVRFRIMIHNTSRDQDDETPFELTSKSPHGCNRIGDRSIKSKNTSKFVPKGLPMKPSRLQHHPSSSNARALTGAVTFMVITLVAIKIHLWSNEIVAANNFSFSVRLYGLAAIVALALGAGILEEFIWRLWDSSCHFRRKGYERANRDAPVGSDLDLNIDNENATERENSRNFIHEATSQQQLNLATVIPGRIYFETEQNTFPMFELCISNGRPSLEHGQKEQNNYDIDRSPSEVALQEVIGAESPGVFYCGPEGLLQTIKKNIHDGRDNNGSTPIAKCAFYEESFEM